MTDPFIVLASSSLSKDQVNVAFASIQRALPKAQLAYIGTDLELKHLPKETHGINTLVLSEDHVCLVPADHTMRPLSVDFTTGKNAHRRQFGGGKGQMIAKAVGLKGNRHLSVLDATAGLGRDSFVLASLGAHVLMLERSPVIGCLLEAGLAKALEHPDTAEIASRMELIEANSINWLKQADYPVADVIYLDPMFPHRDKSSLVKKEMRIFRPIVGDDLDADALLGAAMEKAKYRVVVKRPRKAPRLANLEPAVVMEGKSSRYDIYTIKALP